MEKTSLVFQKPLAFMDTDKITIAVKKIYDTVF
jgi:hypothetical protein